MKKVKLQIHPHSKFTSVSLVISTFLILISIYIYLSFPLYFSHKPRRERSRPLLEALPRKKRIIAIIV